MQCWQGGVGWLVSISTTLRARKVGLAAVRCDGRVLEHAADALRADLEAVLAVANCGPALGMAAPELRRDPVAIVLAMQAFVRSCLYGNSRLGEVACCTTWSRAC